MKKSSVICILSVAALAFVALVIVASFLDLQISKALGDADSFFGQFFRLWGEATGWLVVPLAAGVLFRASNTDKRTGRIVAVVWGTVMFVGWFLTMKYFVDEFTGESYIEGRYGSPYGFLPVHAVVFALIATLLHLWVMCLVKKETAEKLLFLAVAALIALALSQLLTLIMKNVWTRQRFRNLEVGNGGKSSDGFSPWYKPGLGKNKKAREFYFEDKAGMPLKDAYKSFPSGHTSGAAMSFCVALLPGIFEKLKKYRVWFWVCPLAYTILVGLSRVVNRAHYFSDTLFGGLIGVASVFAAAALTDALRKALEKNKFFKKASQALCVDSGDAFSEPSEPEGSADGPNESESETVAPEPSEEKEA